MAAPDNTVLSTVAVGNREELDNVVSRITPEDTPIYTMSGKEKATSTHPEWEIDELEAPGENIQTEGDDYTFDPSDQPARVGNHTQIVRKTGIISNTQEAVSNAGNIVKIAEKKIKKGIEVRKDIELAIVTNRASVAGATRVMGGLPTWLTSNVSRGAGGSNGGFNSGTGLTVAETTGTQRAFTKALLDTVMQSCYQQGANVTKVVCSPYAKSVFVTFMSDANVAEFRYAVDGKGKNTIVGTADIYEGPFGKVMVEPNRVMSTADVARRVFLIDTDMISMKTLRPIHEDTGLAKTGDNKKFAIIGETTLKVHNEAGLGVIADVFGMTVSS
jgi:hypothetical protein